MKLNFKSILPHLVAIASFLIISCIYFSPVFDGYSLKQGDVNQYRGMSKEIEDYRLTHDKEALWTNAMFGGMPAYQISVDYDANVLGKVNKYMQLGLPRPVGLLFIAMLGFYIFALCLRVNPWMGIVGGLAFGLSTINVLYIGAGHITKVNAIAYMAPALGGLMLAFRGRVLLGAAVFSLFFGLNLSCNHFQMTYYLVILLVAVGIAEIIRLLLEKKLQEVLKVIGSLVIAGFIGVLPGIGNVLSTLEYSKYTTRGTTDLTIKPTNAPAEQRATEGLNTNYILEYNYGKGELLSLIAPNAKGAKDDMIGNDEKAMENVDVRYAQQISQMNHYWGGQRMSGGAFYFGVVIFAFFIFGMIFLKDWIRWPFLVVGILALLLASKDPGGVNNFFIHKFPMYNKFRDSKMILVLIQVMLPALAVLFLDRWLDKKEITLQKKPILIVSGILVFIGLILYAVPSISGSFMKSEEVAQFDQAMKTVKDPSQLQSFNEMKQALIDTRIGIYQSEIGRTILLLLVACGIVLLSVYTAMNKAVSIAIALVFIVGDNLSVCKRYLNNEGEGMSFNSYDQLDKAAVPFLPSAADFSILQREAVSIKGFSGKARDIVSKMTGSPLYENITNSNALTELSQFAALSLATDYRVLSFGNPFNETNTSYFHKSIGGYHGAKLKRYQELIDFYVSDQLMKVNETMNAAKNKKLQEYARTTPIAQEQAQSVFDTIQLTSLPLPKEMNVVNMLNVKYLILDPSKPAILNESANGNAWFVDQVISAANSNEEMQKIAGLDTKTSAVVNEEFKAVLAKTETDSNSTIRLTKYDVNELSYQSDSKKEGTAIFSEVWYPEGWNCYVDGKINERIFRANYILRGAIIPAGKHTVVWKFEPKTYANAQKYALLGSISLLLGSVLIFGMALRPLVKAESDAQEKS